jgi:hypothetical protein
MFLHILSLDIVKERIITTWMKKLELSLTKLFTQAHTTTEQGSQDLRKLFFLPHHIFFNIGYVLLYEQWFSNFVHQNLLVVVMVGGGMCVCDFGPPQSF